jgi:hypothetical protein
MGMCRRFTIFFVEGFWFLFVSSISAESTDGILYPSLSWDRKMYMYMAKRLDLLDLCIIRCVLRW